jgi:hypothetical protein
MKNLLIFLLLGLFSCIKQPEVKPQPENLFKNGDFTKPWATNLDLYQSSCACIVKYPNHWYSEPLKGVELAYVMETTFSASITDSTKMYRNYYTADILEIGKYYEFTFMLYDISVDNLKVYQDEELLKEFYPHNYVMQKIVFKATTCNLKFFGNCAVGKMKIKKI